jgi:hypothetical protein
MRTFKELFEKSYGEDSFNEDFLIDAISANGIHESWKAKVIDEIEPLCINNEGAHLLTSIIALLDGYKLTVYQAKHDLGYWYNLKDQAEYDGLEELGTYQLRILQT